MGTDVQMRTTPMFVAGCCHPGGRSKYKVISSSVFSRHEMRITLSVHSQSVTVVTKQSLTPRPTCCGGGALSDCDVRPSVCLLSVANRARVTLVRKLTDQRENLEQCGDLGSCKSITISQILGGVRSLV